MALPQPAETVVNLRDVLGFNGVPLQKYNIPAALQNDEIFISALLGLVGRSRDALLTEAPESSWEPRQEFLKIAHAEDKLSFVSTVEAAAELYGRCSAIRDIDFELLLSLIKLLEDYAGVSKEVTLDARIEINLRRQAKKDQPAWDQRNQTVRRHERQCFYQRVAPVLQAKGFSEEDIPDLIAVEWAEFRNQKSSSTGSGQSRAQWNPSRNWPTGVTLEEKDYGHAIAEGLKEGNGRNWQVTSQLRAPAFPNQFSKEDYVRLAVLEIILREEKSTGILVQIPRADQLSRAERAEVKLLRGRILDGRELRWSDFPSRAGRNYPNELTRTQLLALAARLPTTEPDADEEFPEELGEEVYFSAAEE